MGIKETITVILTEEVKKETIDKCDNLSLPNHYLRRNRHKVNTFIYDVAEGDNRKDSLIIDCIREDLCKCGYTKFIIC